jgi:hypothetical protein
MLLWFISGRPEGAESIRRPARRTGWAALKQLVAGVFGCVSQYRLAQDQDQERESAMSEAGRIENSRSRNIIGNR